jgi:hypothetical protein
MRDANYFAYALALGIKVGMAQKTAHESGHLILPDTRHNQAIAPMPEARLIEICITGEERGPALLEQQSDNFHVLQTLAAKVDTDLPHLHPPAFEQPPLSVEDVLVQDDQA